MFQGMGWAEPSLSEKYHINHIHENTFRRLIRLITVGNVKILVNTKILAHQDMSPEAACRPAAPICVGHSLCRGQQATLGKAA